MIRLALAALALLVLGSQAPARDVRPGFADYRVAEIFRGTPAAVRLTSPGARMFRTQLRVQSGRGANFAGHYALATWGCGSGCSDGAIVDVRTGEVWFPDLWHSVIVPYTTLINGAFFEPNSELLVVRGALSNERRGVAYYRWHGNQLNLLRFDAFSDDLLSFAHDLLMARSRWNERGPATYDFSFNPTPSGSTRSRTIDQVFQLLEDAANAVPARIRATFDPALGYPLTGSIDPTAAPGDEMTFTVTDFKRRVP